MAAGIKVDGLQSAIKAFDLLPKEVNRAKAQALRIVIAKVRGDARRLAAKADAPFIRTYRTRKGLPFTIKPGTLRRAIKSRAKGVRGRPGVFFGELFITEGSVDEKDAFYWRFIEFGTQQLPPRPFIAPAARKAEQNIVADLGRAVDTAVKKVIAKR